MTTGMSHLDHADREVKLEQFATAVREALFRFMRAESDPFPAMIEIYDALEALEGQDIDQQGFSGRIRSWRWLGECIATWIAKGAQVTFYAKPREEPKIVTASGALPEGVEFVPALDIVWAHPFHVNPATGEPMVFTGTTHGPNLFSQWEQAFSNMAREINTAAGADLPMLGPLDTESGLPKDLEVKGA